MPARSSSSTLSPSPAPATPARGARTSSKSTTRRTRAPKSNPTGNLQLLSLDADPLPEPAPAETAQLGKPQLVRSRPRTRVATPRFFCLHIPQFPAWVALQADPNLKLVPFAVYRGGHIVAVSPMAERTGVEAGQFVADAQARCRELELIAQDERREELAWQEVLRAVFRLTPNVESLSRGLLIADAAREDQFNRLVRAWRVPAGIAHDRATAHMAALTAPAGKVRTVSTGFETEFARIVPIQFLAAAGVGDEALQRCRVQRHRQVASLRGLSARQLAEQFGTQGEILWRYAQANREEENLRPVALWEPAEEVSAQRSYELALVEPEEWQEAMADVLRLALCKAGSQRVQTVQITVETALGTFSARRLLREPVGGALGKAVSRLELPAHAALQEALRSHPALEPVILRLEVSLGGFASPLAEVTPLFEAAPAPVTGRLHRVLESVSRYVPEALGLTQPPKQPAPVLDDSWSWPNVWAPAPGAQMRAA